jgi:K+-sensing histidine kinase KdpD
MPSDVRAAYDRAVDDPGILHSGARIAAKLKAKIIVNGTEFNHPGEMSVEDRHSLHEALEALCQLGTSVSAAASTDEARGHNGKNKSPLMGAVGSCLSRAARVFRRKR